MIAGRGHLIGFDDIVNNRLSTTTVRCLSNTGTLLAIDSSKFLNCVNRDEEMVKKFKNYSLEKEDQIVYKIFNSNKAIEELKQ